MNSYNGKTTIAKNNAKTKDIIEALCAVVPIAVDQCRGQVEQVINKTGNPSALYFTIDLIYLQMDFQNKIFSYQEECFQVLNKLIANRFHLLLLG